MHKCALLSSLLGISAASPASPVKTILEEWEVYRYNIENDLIKLMKKSRLEITMKFKTWKLQYGKEYRSKGLLYSEDEINRMSIWMENTAMIE